MSSADFIQIAHGGAPGRPEQLFRAAVSAYCSLTRPSRREIAQLDDLALPLFDLVSGEARRFAAAALSECEAVPAGLLKRLCDEAVEISAPLLIRSPCLRDIDLLGLIGRHGVAHARTISRRSNLSPAITNILRALLARSDIAAPETAVPGIRGAHTISAELDEVRQQLRAMMKPSGTTPRSAGSGWKQPPDAYGKLRSTALTGVSRLFETALADTLGIGPEQAHRISTGASYGSLLIALRALDVPTERAFMVAAAIFPSSFPHPEAIRLFVDRFENLDIETARDGVRGWRADWIAAGFTGSRGANNTNHEALAQAGRQA